MNTKFAVATLTAEHLQELTNIAVQAFRDDPYYESLFGTGNIDKPLYDMFNECAKGCIECGVIKGAFCAETNELVGYIMLFDFNYVRVNNPHYYNSIFPAEYNCNALSTKIAEFVGRYSEYYYILSVAVHPKWQRQGICGVMLDNIRKEFVHYNLISDVSSSVMHHLFCDKFGFEEVFADGTLRIVHHLSNIPNRINECYAKQDIAFVVPDDFDTTLLPDVKRCDKGITQPYIEQLADAFTYRTNGNGSAVVQRVVGTIKTLQYWHRIVNSLFCEEIVVDIDGEDALCYLQSAHCPSNPNCLAEMKMLAEQYDEEFDVETDTFTCVPIEYTSLERLVEQGERPRNINRIIQCLRFRTDYETGMFVDNNDSDSNLSARIKRYYLGCYNVRLYSEKSISFSVCADNDNIISDNLVVGVIASVDSRTSCGVLHLVVMSSNVPISQYLDSVARNQIMVHTENGVVNLYTLLEQKFFICKRGLSKNYVSIHQNRNRLDEQMLASILYSETYYKSEEGLGKVIDPGIMNQLSNESGSAQYNYASLYTHTNTVVQIAPMCCGFQDRIVSETVTMFYVEMVMFEESAIDIMSARIVDFLAKVDAIKPKKIFQNIVALYGEDTKSMEFWDLRLNYPSSRVSINLVRDAFQIDKQRQQLELKKEQLFSVSEVRSNLHSYVESQVVTIVGALLSVISLLECIYAPDKRTQLLFAVVTVAIFILYTRYASIIRKRRK